MQTRRIITSLLVLAVLACGGSAARAIDTAVGVHIGPSGQPTVDLAFFHDNLTPYGQWVSTPAYGQVFVPTVTTGWRPYTNGNWAYTDAGWTWVSADPFGWATDHYGRWAYMDNTGWSWVPGTDWGPAYVSWQSSPSYVGWAPLPPTVPLASTLVTMGPAPIMDIAPASYVFVPVNSFLAPSIAPVALPVAQSLVIFPGTQNITHYRRVGKMLYNVGYPLPMYERAAHRRVARYQLAALRAPALRTRVMGNRLAMFRPVVMAPRNARTAERIALSRHDRAVRLAVRQGIAAQQRLVVARNVRTARPVVVTRTAARPLVIARNHGQARAAEVHLRNELRQSQHLATVHARNQARQSARVVGHPVKALHPIVARQQHGRQPVRVTRVTRTHVQPHSTRMLRTTRVHLQAPRSAHVAKPAHVARPMKVTRPVKAKAHAARPPARAKGGRGHGRGPGF
jgi:hypothetical protein